MLFGLSPKYLSVVVCLWPVCLFLFLVFISLCVCVCATLKYIKQTAMNHPAG